MISRAAFVCLLELSLVALPHGRAPDTVAVDGRANIYALGSFTSGVFKFSREGKFVNHFGGPGHQPGQLSAVNAIAVDGKGRVFVSDTKRVQVFDSDGATSMSSNLKASLQG